MAHIYTLKGTPPGSGGLLLLLRHRGQPRVINEIDAWDFWPMHLKRGLGFRVHWFLIGIREYTGVI